MPLDPIEDLRGNSFVRRLQDNLRFCAGVDRLSGGVEKQQQRRNDQEHRNAESAEQSCGIGLEPLRHFLVQRVEKDGDHRRPCQWHQKRRGDFVHQVAKQQQGTVRKNCGYLVTGGYVSFPDGLCHRYIITLALTTPGYGQDRRKLRMSSSPIPLSRYQYRLLAVLALVNFVNFADRQVFVPLLPLIRAHLSLSDAQLGSLQTYLLAVLAAASLLFGFLADRLSRRAVSAFGVIFWSFATFASGMAGTFIFLLLSRALVGVGEGAYAPAAQSMISGAFPQERRAFAQAV